jgi:hypothetical protein
MIERQSIGRDDKDQAHTRKGLGNTNPVATLGPTLGPGAPSKVSWKLVERNELILYDYDQPLPDADVPLAIIKQGEAIELSSGIDEHPWPNLRQSERFEARIRRAMHFMMAYRVGMELLRKSYASASAVRSIEPLREAAMAQMGHLPEWPAPTAQKPTGPVVLFGRIVGDWDFDDNEAATLLGFDAASHIREVLNGAKPLKSRDANDRLRAVLRIATDLDALFSDVAAIRDWLNESQPELEDKAPRALLTEGSMENLLRVKYYVAHLSGRL